MIAAALADEILVSAAASLTDAFNAVGAAFTKANPRTTVRFNFAAPGPLLRQIEQGAPVDVFAPAATKEMNALARVGRIEPATRVVFAGNRLVLIAPRNGFFGGASSKPWGWYSLADPAVRRVALSNPDAVPSGRYARELLERQGLWERVRPKAVFGQNVRQTLIYVANKDADAGIVFATDARSESKRVRLIATAIPGRDHAPIVYPAAVITGAPNPPAARRFVRFLSSPTAQAVLRRHGFQPPSAAPTRR